MLYQDESKIYHTLEPWQDPWATSPDSPPQTPCRRSCCRSMRRRWRPPGSRLMPRRIRTPVMTGRNSRTTEDFKMPCISKYCISKYCGGGGTVKLSLYFCIISCTLHVPRPPPLLTSDQFSNCESWRVFISQKSKKYSEAWKPYPAQSPAFLSLY